MLGLTGSQYAPKWSYTLEVDVDYPKELQKTHSDLPFLRGRMNIDKYEKLVHVTFTTKETVTHTQNPRAGTRLWTNNGKSIHGKRVKSESHM